jgi:hypothetical protein
LCGVLGHNTRTCTAGPGLDHGRGERARNWRVQEEFDDIIALAIKEMKWTVKDQLQAQTVNADGGNNGNNGDSELSELNSSKFKDIKL